MADGSATTISGIEAPDDVKVQKTEDFLAQKNKQLEKEFTEKKNLRENPLINLF